MAVRAQASCTLSTIVDVEAVYTYYYLASSTITINEAPKDNVNQPGASTITIVSGGQNYVWQLTEPTLNIVNDVIQTAVGQLYIIECTLFSNGTYDWGPLMTSSTYAAAKAAYNLSSQALSQATMANNATSLLGGHFYYNGEWQTENTPHSANVIQNEGINPSEWGYNVHIGSNGIKIRNNEITLSEWTSNALIFYKPNTTNSDTVIKAIELDANALKFYDSEENIKAFFGKDEVVIGQTLVPVNVNNQIVDSSGNQLVDSSGNYIVDYFVEGISSEGYNIRVDSNGFYVRDGLITLASYGAITRIGVFDDNHIDISATGMELNRGNNLLMHVGYGTPVTGDSSGNTAFYVFGKPFTSGESSPFNTIETYEIGSTCLYNNKDYIRIVETGTNDSEWNDEYWQPTIGGLSTNFGMYNYASGHMSIAEGEFTKSLGFCSHSFGFHSIALGSESIAMGFQSKSIAESSIAGGYMSETTGEYSFAYGIGNIAQGQSQTVIGMYNSPQGTTNDTISTDFAFIIGNGSGFGNANRSNAFTVDWGGTISLNGIKRIGGKGIYTSSDASGTLYYGFGNNEEITRINTKTTSVDSTGTSFMIANGYYAIGSTESTPTYNNENVYISGGRDTTSRWVAIPNAYNRTYSNTSGLYALYVTSNGILGRYASSSIRYKHDVEYLTNSDKSVINNKKVIQTRSKDDSNLTSVLNLPIAKFKYNEGYVTGDANYDYSKFELGFIAEDVASICPECATYKKDETGKDIPEAYDTRQILIRMLYVIQQQDKRIAELEHRVLRIENNK